MKKFLIGVVVFSVLVVALGVAGFAYAQNQTPPNPSAEYPFGYGPMAGFGGHGYGMMGFGYGMRAWNGEEGPMHEAMVTALSEALGLSVEEIESRHDAGETLWEIAEAQGLSSEEVRELILSAHDSALAEAVTNGWLTQEQADWMDENMERMWNGNLGYGGHCGGSRFYKDGGWDSGS